MKTDLRTYEYLHDMSDLYYINELLKWYKALLAENEKPDWKGHLRICIQILKRKLKGTIYENLEVRLNNDQR